MTPIRPKGSSAATATGLLADPVDQAIRYHVQTKHQFHQYARSMGYLDWANQPDPFRRFKGTTLYPLPLLKPDDEPRSPPYDAIYQRGAVQSQSITVVTLSRFLELALALSAWKRAGDAQWALRNNPSSGNLHPTEGYLVLPPMQGLDLPPGLYHYAPKEHGLELRVRFADDLSQLVLKAFPPQSFLVGLSSIHWREAWKYGERAFRYCNHDVGHAVGTLRLAAATLGWSMTLLDGCDQGTIAHLLGTDRQNDFTDAEQEHPDCVAVVWPSDGVESEAAAIPLQLDAARIEGLVDGPWYGKANRLSRGNPLAWPIIDDVAAATWKPNTEPPSVTVPTNFTDRALSIATDKLLSAAQIIRQRRSAVAFDGTTEISSATFFQMLKRVLPATELPQLERPVPWDVLPWDPMIHLQLFVHRVNGLAPGIYFLVRDRRQLPSLQRSMNQELAWAPAPGCPEDIPLYWLLEGDVKNVATQVSCHQDIAGDSAFSLGMLAEFEGRLSQAGAWWYPRFFWEAGLLGQVLYLEAEAAGVRATGIGCFFDDPVHEILEIRGLTFQSVYHFTVGGAVDDERLMTLPPYPESR